MVYNELNYNNMIGPFMQVDHCTEAKMLDEDVDLKAGIPSDIMAETSIKIVCSAPIQEEMPNVNGQYK